MGLLMKLLHILSHDEVVGVYWDRDCGHFVKLCLICDKEEIARISTQRAKERYKLPRLRLIK